MKIHEKMNLFNSNFETEQEKFLKVKFIFLLILYNNELSNNIYNNFLLPYL